MEAMLKKHLAAAQDSPALPEKLKETLAAILLNKRGMHSPSATSERATVACSGLFLRKWIIRLPFWKRPSGKGPSQRRADLGLFALGKVAQ
eukprot:533096-Amphidinium_carterae.1